MSLWTVDSRVVTSCALAVSSHRVWRAGLLLEVAQLDAQPRDVEHLLDAGQRGVERLQVPGHVVAAFGGHERSA